MLVYIWGYDRNIKEEMQKEEQEAKDGILGFIYIWSQQNLVKPSKENKKEHPEN